ncbi:uncharacterized protein VTP21DRAFT_9537 [Calcarisporiella thermophila]|uniref:uncharacterized protein n=1 Tax=Calcarisporiella thermophila TaxID=911321 RepID=UPI0037436D93
MTVESPFSYLYPAASGTSASGGGDNHDGNCSSGDCSSVRRKSNSMTVNKTSSRPIDIPSPSSILSFLSPLYTKSPPSLPQVQDDPISVSMTFYYSKPHPSSTSYPPRLSAEMPAPIPARSASLLQRKRVPRIKDTASSPPSPPMTKTERLFYMSGEEAAPSARRCPPLLPSPVASSPFSFVSSSSCSASSATSSTSAREGRLFILDRMYASHDPTTLHYNPIPPQLSQLDFLAPSEEYEIPLNTFKYHETPLAEDNTLRAAEILREARRRLQERSGLLLAVYPPQSSLFSESVERPRGYDPLVREVRANPDFLRMLSAETRMIRARKLRSPLKMRHYLPRRTDGFFPRPSRLRHVLEINCSLEGGGVEEEEGSEASRYRDEMEGFFGHLEEP